MISDFSFVQNASLLGMLPFCSCTQWGKFRLRIYKIIHFHHKHELCSNDYKFFEIRRKGKKVLFEIYVRMSLKVEWKEKSGPDFKLASNLYVRNSKKASLLGDILMRVYSDSRNPQWNFTEWKDTLANTTDTKMEMKLWNVISKRILTYN